MSENREWSLYRLNDATFFTNISFRHIELAYSLMIRFETKNWAFCGPKYPEWQLFIGPRNPFQDVSESLKVED